MSRQSLRYRKSAQKQLIANQNLRDLYIQIDGLLENRLDKLMEGFRSSQPEFFVNMKKHGY
jgi:hypothetical protein